MRDINSTRRVNALVQRGATHYISQLGLPDKDRAMKGLVVCYVVWLGSLKGLGLRTSQRGVDVVPC